MIKEKLQSTRTRKGFTQAQLAEVIHTTTPNYCRKEKGEVKISRDEWKKLAVFLEVFFEDIYEEDDAKVNINTENQTGDNIGNYYNYSIHQEMLKHIMDYVNLLKVENDKLKEKITTP